MRALRPDPFITPQRVEQKMGHSVTCVPYSSTFITGSRISINVSSLPASIIAFPPSESYEWFNEQIKRIWYSHLIYRRHRLGHTIPVRHELERGKAQLFGKRAVVVLYKLLDATMRSVHDVRYCCFAELDDISIIIRVIYSKVRAQLVKSERYVISIMSHIFSKKKRGHSRPLHLKNLTIRKPLRE